MNSPNFLIFDASAGSGKTFTLTKEYIKILLASPTADAYKSILAITFTNKAVNEMKTRIVSSLLEFSKDEPSEKSLDLLHKVCEELKITPETVKQKSRVIIKNIIHNYASFDISTIDKFTHRLIRAFAIDLDLPVTFEISLDKNALLKEAVDRIIAKAGTDKLLTNLLLDFALSKVNESGSWDFTRELLEIGTLIGDENHENELEQIKNISLADFIEIRKDFIENRDLIKEQVVNLAQKLLQFLTQQPYGLDAFSRKTIPNHLVKIADGDFKNAFDYHEIKVVEDRILKKQFAAVAPDLEFIFSQLYDIKKWAGRYLLFDNVVKNITPLSLLNSIANEVKLIQQEQNILSISEFNKIIHNQIQNQPAPFIYERLGDRYKYFFIDEFQDTSEMQWKNLIPLINNALSGDAHQPGSLMLVGDAKQSIYRWRGGKAEQFIDLSKDGAAFNPFPTAIKEKCDLDTNYRSYTQVVEFNNGFFKYIASKLEHPDYYNLYDETSFQKTKDKIGGFVSVDFIPDIKATQSDGSDVLDELSKDDLYLERVIQIIQNCLAQGFNYKDIALLTRKRDKGILLANCLIANGIPIISSETLLLSNSEDVNFIINILHLLHNFNDTEAKFNVLYYIKTITNQTQPTHNFIYQGIGLEDEASFENYILPDPNIKFSFSANKTLNLYQICENIIAVFMSHKANIAYVQYFLDLVLEQEVKQISLADFLDYWHTKKEVLSIPSPENVNAVNIMTIHKSKGLEFPVIIFPFVNDKIIRAAGDKMWVDLPTTNQTAFTKALINKKAEVVHYNDQIADLFKITNDKITLDTINVLYVALTRAEEQLYVISEKKNVKTNKTGLDTSSVAHFFLEYLTLTGQAVAEKDCFTFGSPIKISKSKPVLNQNKVITLVNQTQKGAKSFKIAQKEALLWGSNRGQSIEFGNLVHELLAEVKYPTDIDFVAEQALRKGKILFRNFEKIKYILKSIVNDARLKEHFNSDAKVFNERSIVNVKFNTIKPDRVTIFERKATLLDYKTGAKHNSHLQQVLEYEKALTDMGYQVVKKTLVYIGDDVEEIVNL